MLPSPIPTGALPPPTPDELKSALGIQELTIEWLAGDGSDRSYYRIKAPLLARPVVLMQLSGNDARALHEGRYDWLEVANILAVHGIKVPRLVKSMPDQAAIIIEDYGNTMLETRALELLGLSSCKVDDVFSLYSKANEILIHFLEIKVPTDPREERPVWTRRAFDAERFEWELNFFLKKFVEPVARIKLTPAQNDAVKAEILDLAACLARLPQHFVHRDFHSRNIMLFEDRQAVIDFQDARLGPASYDAVSLCFDSYVPFSSGDRLKLMDQFLRQVGLKLGSPMRTEIEQQWKSVLLQRQLKAIGSFGYLTIDKNKGNYLRYVKPAIAAMRAADVRDSRWPFLSVELVDLIDSAMGS